MSEPVALPDPAPSDRWHERSLRWWHLVFAVAPLGTLGFVAIMSDRSDSLPLAAAALGSMTLLWFAFGWRSFTSVVWRTVFQALLIIALAVAIAAAPNAAIVQCVIFPFIWASIESVRATLIVNGIVAVGGFIGFSWALRESPYGVIAGAAISLVSLLFSIALGLWITRIADWGNQRARLLAELTAAQEELARVNREQGMASERERLARELHDTIAQSLTGLVMIAQRVASSRTLDPGVRTDIDLIESIGRDTLGETRALVASSASVQVEGGLATAAERLAGRYRRETGIHLDVEVDAEVPRELEVVVLRCMQEALANVRKHANAASAHVRIESDRGALTLEVVDDGVGISAGAASKGEGFGLSGMRERLALVGGQLTVGPGPQGGTLLRATMPLGESSLTPRRADEVEQESTRTVSAQAEVDA